MYVSATKWHKGALITGSVIQCSYVRMNFLPFKDSDNGRSHNQYTKTDG